LLPTTRRSMVVVADAKRRDMVAKVVSLGRVVDEVSWSASAVLSADQRDSARGSALSQETKLPSADDVVKGQNQKSIFRP
jgi:hypothetical protein